MKVLIATDSFKNSLSSLQVGESIKKGLASNKNIKVNIQQLSDGGEGALNVFLENGNFEKISTNVINPIGKTISACYGINKTKNIAFIEMAQASGLELLTPKNQNPLFTTSYGVGQIILDAYNKGIRNFILSLGGSATNDGGAGLLSALGIKFIGTNNEYITNSELDNITNINIDRIKIEDCKFKILVDVDNPLLGENGATHVYAKQKGAKKEDMIYLENNLKNFSYIVSKFTNTNFSNLKGSGAAGGIAFGLKSFFDTQIVSGISEIIKISNLEQQIVNADIIISGEGSIDAQSQSGKVISGVANLCLKNNKPFFLIAGKVDYTTVEYFYNKGCLSVFSIQDQPQSLENSIKRTSELLKNVGRNIANIIKNQP